jgi:hypothetical protein
LNSTTDDPPSRAAEAAKNKKQGRAIVRWSLGAVNRPCAKLISNACDQRGSVTFFLRSPGLLGLGTESRKKQFSFQPAFRGLTAGGFSQAPPEGTDNNGVWEAANPGVKRLG